MKALTSLAAIVGIILALSWLGPIAMDSGGPQYQSYGYRAGPEGDAIADAAAASIAADVATCQHLHGSNATAVHMPDGQHRCTDKHGRKLSTRSGIVLAHEVTR